MIEPTIGSVWSWVEDDELLLVNSLEASPPTRVIPEIKSELIGDEKQIYLTSLLNGLRSGMILAPDNQVRFPDKWTYHGEICSKCQKLCQQKCCR